MGPSVAVMDAMKFSFDAQEAIAMADPKDNASGGAGGMTLADATKLLGDLAPQVANLQAAFAALSGGAIPAAPAPAAADKEPPAPAPGAAPAPTPAPAPAAALPPAAGAMDAAFKTMGATLDGLVKTVAAMDTAIKGLPARMVADTAQRDQLAGRIADHVGTFDHADKTLSQVAAYGCEKFGLKPPAGAEVFAVEAYLTGKGAATAATVRHAADHTDAAPGDNFVTRHLSGTAAK